jgi:hypothetical protein
VRHILTDIVGFDLNPLAVIAARTNYLLALGNLIRHLPSVEIPVYLCDSVLTPAGTSGAEPAQTQALFNDYELTSTVGTFAMPRAVVVGGHLADIARMLEDAVKLRYTTDEFQQRVHLGLPDLDDQAISSLGLLFEKLGKLERDGRNGLWARLIKNAFAPVFAGRFEFVIGNPPWIRWTYLADAYRAATLPMWTEYGLFSLRGMAARLGSGEKDFSMLFTYAAADRYLAEGGTLGFVITQEVVKGKGAGEGFRRFRIGRSGAELKVVKAHDLVAVAPFEGASNKTSVLVLRKGEPTVYPLPYTKWRRNSGVGYVPTDATLRRALELTSREDLVARPIATSSVSAWQTAPQSSIGGFNAFRGTAAYVARRGAGTDPYGVFWLRVLEVRDGVLAVENLPELGKRDVEKVSAQLIEPDLVYPAIRGSDIRRWAARPEISVLVTQDPATRRPYPAHDLRVRLPLTYQYLERFRDVLLSRGSATIRELAERTEPWAMFGIGEYTFAPYRVTWKRMASELVAAVLGTWHTAYGPRLLVPTETTSFIPAQTIEEAHYLAAVLNAPPVRAYVLSFSAPGRGFGAPSIMQQVALPAYNPANAVHAALSAAGARAAELAASQAGAAQAELVQIERELARLVADLFGIPEKDLRAMLRTELPAGPLGLHD